MKKQNRQFIELKKWLIEEGIKQKDVAKKAGVTDAAVWIVMQGRGTSANIKNTFLSLGCPPELWEKEAA